MSEKKDRCELDDEELDDVMGGMSQVDSNATCEYFLEENLNGTKTCDNCFYGHKIGNDVFCSLPQK